MEGLLSAVPDFDFKEAEVLRQIAQHIPLGRISMAMLHEAKQSAAIDGVVFDELGGDHFFDMVTLSEGEQEAFVQPARSFVERLMEESLNATQALQL